MSEKRIPQGVTGNGKSSESLFVRKDRFRKNLRSSSFFDIKKCIPFVKTGSISSFLAIHYIFSSRDNTLLHPCIAVFGQDTTALMTEKNAEIR